MIALTGKILLVLAFLGGIISLPAYFFSAKNEESGFLKVANVLFTIKGLLVAGASAILIFLILNHRFDFYYVYKNKTLVSKLEVTVCCLNKNSFQVIFKKNLLKHDKHFYIVVICHFQRLSECVENISRLNYRKIKK